MAFEKYNDIKLIKIIKSLKTVLLVFAVIWLLAIFFYVSTQISDDGDKKKITTTALPFLLGPVTLLPIIINYQNARKELQRRKSE